jgi:hypothetical protein
MYSILIQDIWKLFTEGPDFLNHYAKYVISFYDSSFFFWKNLQYKFTHYAAGGGDAGGCGGN